MTQETSAEMITRLKDSHPIVGLEFFRNDGNDHPTIQLLVRTADYQAIHAEILNDPFFSYRDHKDCPKHGNPDLNGKGGVLVWYDLQCKPRANKAHAINRAIYGKYANDH